MWINKETCEEAPYEMIERLCCTHYAKGYAQSHYPEHSYSLECTFSDYFQAGLTIAQGIETDPFMEENYRSLIVKVLSRYDYVS